MLNKVYKLIRDKYAHEPSFLGIFINPYFFTRTDLWRTLAAFSKHINGKILDIGCGRKPYKKLFNYSEYIGLEMEDYSTPLNNKKPDVLYDGKTIPFENEFFDSVVSFDVLEHVFTPNEFLTEINRVLKPKGKLLLNVPFLMCEHEHPFDYARYSSFGLKHLLEKNNFQIVKQEKTSNNISAVFQIINLHIVNICMRKHFFINLLLSRIFIAPLNCIGFILSKILPKDDDLYLNNVILAEKI